MHTDSVCGREHIPCLNSLVSGYKGCISEGILRAWTFGESKLGSISYK